MELCANCTHDIFYHTWGVTEHGKYSVQIKGCVLCGDCDKFTPKTKGGESVETLEQKYAILYQENLDLKSERDKMVERIRSLENKWRNYLGNFAERLRTEFPEIFPDADSVGTFSLVDSKGQKRNFYIDGNGKLTECQ